jgi:hypothetical protein
MLVGAVGIEPSVLLQTRNLFIPRSDESDKNARNDEVRYKKGTKETRATVGFSAVPGDVGRKYKCAAKLYEGPAVILDGTS